jgi:hypothetical protein
VRTGLAFILISAVLVIGDTGPSAAAPITVGYSGVIDSITDPFGQLPPGIGLGTPFTGTYTVDPDAVTGVAQPDTGYVQHIGAGLGSIELDVGGNLIGQPLTTVGIGDVIGGAPFAEDFWNTITPEFETVPLGSLASAVSFSDSTDTRISDPFDFFVNTSLTDWDDPKAGIWVARGGIGPAGGGFVLLARGEITSLQVLPEPSTALLMGLGLLGLGARRRTT